MVSLVHGWLPDREIKLMGDTASCVLEWGGHARAQQVTLITTGRLDAGAIFSTHPSQSAEEIIQDVMKRWSLEVTFEASRAHLGSETQRQGSDLAIERSTSLALWPLQPGRALWAGVTP